jgi:hypothetical protein
MRGLAVIRTVWLAVLCLSGLGAMVAINAGTSTHQPTVAASPEQTTVGKTFSQDTLTKADKLESAYVRDAIAVEPAIKVTKAPDETPPQLSNSTAATKIVSRHWHDPCLPADVSRAKRRAYHARIAHVIAEQFGDIAETQPAS